MAVVRWKEMIVANILFSEKVTNSQKQKNNAGFDSYIENYSNTNSQWFLFSK